MLRAKDPNGPTPEDPVHRALASLPRPRKHYQWYYSTREADGDMHRAPQGLHDFLRAYYHHKSADWKDNKPIPLRSWSATELARLPTYCVMDLAKTMPETVAEEMPSTEQIAAASWLPDEELAPEDLDYVIFYEKPLLKFERIVAGYAAMYPRSRGAFVRAMQAWLGQKLWIRSQIR